MEKPCVLVIYRRTALHQCAEASLKKHFTIITYEQFIEASDQYAERIVAVFVWGPSICVTRELLQKLPKLQVVASGGVGVDRVDIPLINSFGLKVCNMPHVVDNATADLGMALMLVSARKIIEGHNFSKYRESEERPDIILSNDVSGATLGIIGMGRIGYKVAKRAQSFDMTMLYHNRNRRKEEEERAVGAVYCEKLEELLQKSDFVMVVVDLSPQTHKLIGAKELNDEAQRHSH